MVVESGGAALGPRRVAVVRRSQRWSLYFFNGIPGDKRGSKPQLCCGVAPDAGCCDRALAAPGGFIHCYLPDQIRPFILLRCTILLALSSRPEPCWSPSRQTD